MTAEESVKTRMLDRMALPHAHTMSFRDILVKICSVHQIPLQTTLHVGNGQVVHTVNIDLMHVITSNKNNGCET